MHYGIFSYQNESPRVGIRHEDRVVDLSVLAELGVFDFDSSVFYEPFLNEFMALGREVHRRARQQVQSWLEDNADHPEAYLSADEVTMHLPVRIGDYTDFYSSIEHATNVGKMFRDPENALLPNWKHLPVGYHGRASSIVVSGTDIKRPSGQVKTNKMDAPEFRPSERLDFELEMAFVISQDSTLGEPIPVDEAKVVSRSNTKYLYWSMAQQLAHHTSNGCNVRVGDLMASGTISGKDASSYGSLLEISEGGRKPFTLADGSERSFLEDGDTVTMRAWGERDGVRVELGSVAGRII